MKAKKGSSRHKKFVDRHGDDVYELVAFKGDQQQATVDVSPQGEGFAVRRSGLVSRRRPVEIDHSSRYVILDPEARAREMNCWEQDRPLPPFHYGVSFVELAFRNTTFDGT
jgi:hypothetical protein